MEAQAKPEEKFKIIQQMTQQDNNLLNISWLCEYASVSRSGYYNWICSREARNRKDEQDKKDFEIILAAYQFRGYDKGKRGIYMRLLNMGIRMNQKKISRLMNKFNLRCPIRKANPYRRMAKALKTSNVADNLLNREFKEHGISLTRGNCWDNAPQESFFGHMKDEIHIERCHTFKSSI